MSAVESGGIPTRLLRTASSLIIVLLSIAAYLPESGHAELSSESAPTIPGRFEAISDSLLQAIESPDEQKRKVHLREAQDSFDKIIWHDEASVGGEANGGLSDFEREVENSIGLAEVALKKRLYLNLMKLVWEGPYTANPEDDLKSLKTVSDALETLHTISEIDVANRPRVGQIQSAYFRWLESRRDKAGLNVSAIHEKAGQRVFDQRVTVSDSGEPIIYQLIGMEDRRVKWQAVDGTKIDSVANIVDSVSLDLSRVRAPWVIFISGSDLEQYIAKHRSWIEALRKHSLIILIERQDYADLIRSLPVDLLSQSHNPLYLFPDLSSTKTGTLLLVNTLEQEVIAQWPTSYLDHDHAEVLKALIQQLTSIPAQR